MIPRRRLSIDIIGLFGIDPETDDDWRTRALCAQTDPESFYPEKGGSGHVREAKRVCLACDVTEDCLAYALDNDERFGIWGGMTEGERRKVRRQRRHTTP